MPEMENVVSDKHRQVMLEGLVLSEESKTVNSAALKPEEIGQEENANMLKGTERTKFRVGCAVRREGDMHEDVESDTRKLEDTDEGRQVFESVGDANMETRQRDEG